MARFTVDLDEPNLIGRKYGVQLTVPQESRRDTAKNVDIGKFVKQIRITHDVDNIWPEIAIELDIDAYNLISNDIFGQKTLQLKIVRSDQDTDIKETHVIDLLYLESDMNLTSRTYWPEENGGGHIDLQTTTMLFIPLFAYNMMSTFVNALVEEGDQPTDGVQLLENLMLGTLKFDQRKVKIDKRGRNTSFINQMVIPPMTLKDVIEYLNSAFYYYMGPAFTFCDLDGTFRMWSLHEKMKDSQALNIVLFPASSPTSPIQVDDLLKLAAMKEKGKPGMMFAEQLVETAYNGNLTILTVGYDRISTSHPGDNLYSHVINNMTHVANNHSISDPDTLTGLKIHPNLKNRKRYSHNNGGTNPGNSSDELSTSKISEDILNMNGLVTTVTGNLFFEDLFKIGEPVVFDGISQAYTGYGGKYLLWRSDLLLSRKTSDDWDAEAMLTMYRSNHSNLYTGEIYDRLPNLDNLDQNNQLFG